jgi:hypothetical protein
VSLTLHVRLSTDRQIDINTTIGRWKYGETDRWRDGHTDRSTDRQMGNRTDDNIAVMTFKAFRN